MKISKFIYIIIACLGLSLAFTCPELVPETNAASAAVAKKRSSSKKKKTSGKSSRKGTSKKRKSRKKSSSSKKGTTRKVTPAPPKEVISNDSLTLLVNDALLQWIPADLNPGGLRVNSVKPDSIRKVAAVNLNENFTYLPVTRQLIDSISRHVSVSLPDSIADYRVALNVGTHGLSYYITKVDKLPEKYRKNPAFVTEVNPSVHPKKGMENDIIALWHSHGRYFKPGSGAWMWQRPLLFQSVEDTYTMSFVLPYLVPMLENAGAYVMLPRERDINRHEVIVDNDTNDGGNIYSQPYYKEMTGSNAWATGEEEGFIYDLADFRDTENPFENGTYRQTLSTRHGKPSVAAWYADIPEDGEYAVYISYKSLPNSTRDARYTVNYSGGSKEFRVNQTMGGGTWIYLGTFPFEKGYSDTEPVVTLSNHSESADGLIVTADAIKIGGGMGNIARSNHRSDVYYDPSTPDKSLASDDEEESDDEEADDEETGDEDDDTESADDIAEPAPADSNPSETKAQTPTPAAKRQAPTFRTSGMPRFLEGARYWLHWAGMPEYVYSPYHGSDDYKDDYTSRGHWVNYLAGGSRVLPDREGLNIPVDAVFALHSDAGKRSDDSFVGTLGIYFSQNGDSYADGTPRINSRMLTDIIMRQITNDIRQQYEPRWTRRSMWDKSYVEARVPEVPTTLIELMSHQNYADMMYGLDPNFKFTVARAIYKGLARFMAERKDRELVIQPLPVKDFAIRRVKKGHYRLSWEPTPDPLEKTAMPAKYIVYERREGDLGFHKISETHSAHYEITVKDDRIHSFRIVAANDGGVSFPSETLAFREAPGDSKPVLIVNGFTRVSGPQHFASPERAGFEADRDFGVPYVKDIAFTGNQTEFNRGAGESFGRSASNYVTQVIAGNTFDYPAIHGESIAESGLGFVSASAGAVEAGDVNLSDYNTVDLILGKQKTTVIGNGKSGILYRAFPEKLQACIETFLNHGGHLIVSGENVVSDLYDMRSSHSERVFAEKILGSEYSESNSSRTGSVSVTGNGRLDYSNTLNDKHYIIQNPDILNPIDDKADVFMTFTDSGAAAGYVADSGKGRIAVMSVPLESFTDESARDTIMKQILNLLSRR